MESEVEFSDGTSSVAVGPICLPKPDDVGDNQYLRLCHIVSFYFQDFFGKTGTAIGWGDGDGGITNSIGAMGSTC